MTFEPIPEITPQEQEDAAKALIGACIEFGGDPTCGLRDVVGALGLLGSPEDEEERPQVDVVKKGAPRNGVHEYTAIEDIQIWDKEYPDAELARKMKVSTAAIQQRRHALKLAR
jgi:hypothetical protein